MDLWGLWGGGGGGGGGGGEVFLQRFVSLLIKYFLSFFLCRNQTCSATDREVMYT